MVGQSERERLLIGMLSGVEYQHRSESSEFHDNGIH